VVDPSNAIFTRAANSIFRASLAGGAALILGVPVFLMVWVRTPFDNDELEPTDQPVEFDHRHHVADDGLDCLYCHWPAARSAYAGIPATQVCMNCHGQIWNEATLLEPVRRSFYQNVPIAWQKIYRLPDFVFFNHAAHINRGVGCSSCHGRVDHMARVYRVVPLTMGWCLECHRAPERFLRPLDRITDMSWTGEPDPLAVGRAIKETLGIRPPLTCSGCHR
jgi:hypothetical protein